MAREIRRVPPNWVHPRYTREETNDPGKLGQYRPLYDEAYEPAVTAWLAELALWERGEHTDQRGDPQRMPPRMHYWEWNGNPPDRESYRTEDWPRDQATCYQMYETVSEGTPVSPVFATKAELIDYLVANGDESDQRQAERRPWEWPNGTGWTREAAESFVESEYAPSMITLNVPGQPVQTWAPQDGLPPRA